MANKTEEKTEREIYFDGIVENMPIYAKELIAGGVAGGFSKTAVAPLERVKILFQTRKEEFQSRGLIGNGRIVPYAALHFMAYEQYRCLIIDTFPNSSRGPILDLDAGSFAGGTAVLFTYPLDLVRTKLSYQMFG